VNGETAPINVLIGLEVDVPAVHRSRRGDHVTSVWVVDAVVVVDDANVVNCPIVGVIVPGPVVLVDSRDDVASVRINRLLFNKGWVVDTDTHCSSSLFPHILGGEPKVSRVHSFRGLVLEA